MATLVTYLWLALGGALGTAARFALDGFVSNRFGKTFPYGILVINIIGSFVIGFLASLTGPQGRWLASPTVRGFLMVGICGGFTTFSSFSLNTLSLAQEGQWFRAGVNVVVSIILCLLAVWLGYSLGAMGGSKSGG